LILASFSLLDVSFDIVFTMTAPAVNCARAAARRSCSSSVLNMPNKFTARSNHCGHLVAQPPAAPPAATAASAKRILMLAAKSSDATSATTHIRNACIKRHAPSNFRPRRRFSAAAPVSPAAAADVDLSDHMLSPQDRPPVTSFSEDELLVRDLCRQWGDEVLRPVVRDMDEEGRTDPDIIEGLFDCGLMGMVRVDDGMLPAIFPFVSL